MTFNISNETLQYSINYSFSLEKIIAERNTYFTIEGTTEVDYFLHTILLTIPT